MQGHTFSRLFLHFKYMYIYIHNILKVVCRIKIELQQLISFL